MVLEYNVMEAGFLFVLLLLSMFVVVLLVGRCSGRWRPSSIVCFGFVLVMVGMAVLVLIVLCVESGWVLVVLLIVVGLGFGLLVL